MCDEPDLDVPAGDVDDLALDPGAVGLGLDALETAGWTAVDQDLDGVDGKAGRGAQLIFEGNVLVAYHAAVDGRDDLDHWRQLAGHRGIVGADVGRPVG